jgi:hypothetical protein
LFAITTVGTNLMSDRGDQKGDFDTEIQNLKDSGF